MARLVICDDEGHITDILSRFFREKGHEVFGTTRAEEALEHILSRETDLVITDIAMKGLSGLELLKQMKFNAVDVPVIITTGNPSHNTAVEALRGGAFDYVVKPFHLGEIAERSERALVNKRMREENVLYSKLVSLHAISKVLAEADNLDDLSTKVIRLGAKLTQSDTGWYWANSPDSVAKLSGFAIHPGPGDMPGASAPPGGAARPGSAAPHDAVNPLDSATPLDSGNLELHAYLLRLARATAERCDLLVTDSERDLPGKAAWFLSMPVEVGSGIHGILIFRKWKLQGMYDPVDLEVFSQLGSTFSLSIRALGFFPAPSAPDFSQDEKALRSWAGLVGQMVDEHCLGYESKYQRVTALGEALMKELHWPAASGKEWPLICRIYDLSKLRVPQRLLEKRKPLTDKELEFIRSQFSWAWERLSSVAGLGGTVRILEDWQERYDGKGNPRGTRGHSISPLGRLLAVADTYIALISGRPYRGPFPETEAMEMVRRDSGMRFDPEIVLALSRIRGL